MNGEQIGRALVAAERIGTGLLRLAAAAEARNVADAERRAEEEPRQVGTHHIRPADVIDVRRGLHKSGGYDRDVVKITLRGREEDLIVYRAHHGGSAGWIYDETREECLTRVLTALGWA